MCWGYGGGRKGILVGMFEELYIWVLVLGENLLVVVILMGRMSLMFFFLVRVMRFLVKLILLFFIREFLIFLLFVLKKVKIMLFFKMILLYMFIKDLIIVIFDEILLFLIWEWWGWCVFLVSLYCERSMLYVFFKSVNLKIVIIGIIYEKLL